MVDPDKLAYAAHLRDSGATIAEIVTKTGITRTSLYRHLPPRPAEPVTAAGTSAPRGNLESITWPPGYAPDCPTCRQPTSGLRETRAKAHGQIVIIAVAEPCGHPVDEHAAALQAAAPR